MTEKAIFVHESAVRRWATMTNPPLPLDSILQALTRMDEIKRVSSPEDIILVEESPTTGFDFLPGKVGKGNSARLLGARAPYCLRIARRILEEAGIEVTLDNIGALP